MNFVHKIWETFFLSDIILFRRHGLFIQHMFFKRFALIVSGYVCDEYLRYVDVNVQFHHEYVCEYVGNL